MDYLSIVRFVPDVPLSLGEGLAKGALLVGFIGLFLFAIWVRFLVMHEVYGGGDDAIPVEELTNCPSCGARITVEAETCEYCGEPIEQ